MDKSSSSSTPKGKSSTNSNTDAGIFEEYMKYNRNLHTRHGTDGASSSDENIYRSSNTSSSSTTNTNRINADDLLRQMDKELGPMSDDDDENDSNFDDDDDDDDEEEDNMNEEDLHMSSDIDEGSDTETAMKNLNSSPIANKTSSSNNIKRSESASSIDNTNARTTSSTTSTTTSSNNTKASGPVTISEADRNTKAGEYREKGNARYKERDYNGAIQAYTSAIDCNPSSSVASLLYTNRAAAYMMILDYVSAGEDCTRAITADPNNLKAYVRAGKAELSRGNIEEAIRMYSKAIEIDPNDKTLKEEKLAAQNSHKRMGTIRAANENGEYDKAISQLSLLIETCPGAIQLKLMRIDNYINLNKLEDAEKASKELMTPSGKKDPAILYSRARVLHYSGLSSQAEAHVTEALRFDPEHAPSAKLRRLIRKAEELKKKGNDAFKAGQYEQALEFYQNALEIDGRNMGYNARLYANRASAWSKLNKTAEAFDDATNAIEACDTWSKGYIRRALAGVAFGDNEHLQGAIRDYHKAKELAEKEGDKDTIREVDVGIKSTKKLLKKFKRKDYYSILGVERTCTEEELKKGYRKAALKWHPDRHTGANEEEKKKAESHFKDVNEAYSILSNSTKRQQYDSGMVPDGTGTMGYPQDSDDEGHGHGGGGMRFRSGGGGMGGGMPFNMGGMGGMGGMPRGGMGGMGGMGGGMGGIDPAMFAEIFGAMGGGGGGIPMSARGGSNARGGRR